MKRPRLIRWIWFVLGAALLAAMAFALLRTAEPHAVEYATFTRLVREGRVASVTLRGAVAEVRLRESARVPTTRGLLEDVLGFSVRLPPCSDTLDLVRSQNVELRTAPGTPPASAEDAAGDKC